MELSAKSCCSLYNKSYEQSTLHVICCPLYYVHKDEVFLMLKLIIFYATDTYREADLNFHYSWPHIFTPRPICSRIRRWVDPRTLLHDSKTKKDTCFHRDSKSDPSAVQHVPIYKADFTIWPHLHVHAVMTSWCLWRSSFIVSILFLKVREWPAYKSDNITDFCEPIVWKMWELQHLTTLWASTSCYTNKFNFSLIPFYFGIKGTVANSVWVH
jgi:hypothetical protein